jgi:trk system potassium uptake protein TrkA
MRILLVGGHQKANFLTKALKAKGHDITVINEDHKWCEILTNAYEIVSIIGDGTRPDILETACIGKMDTVVALSNKDAANLVVCEIAKKQFHVKNTFAVVNDPKNLRLFKELGVNKCVSSTQMLSDIIDQEAIKENLKYYLPDESCNVAVCEIDLNDKSPVINKKLWEIGLPNDSVVCCIVRMEQTIIPQGNTELKAGDKIIILSYSIAIDKVNVLFAGR